MNNVEQDLARLAWADELGPMCLTLIRGADEEEVIRRYGGDPSTSVPLTPEEWWDLQPSDYHEHRNFVGVGTVAGPGGGLVYAVEHNGYTGDIPRIIRNLSADGRCFSIYLHVNAADGVGYAVGGELVVHEEPWGTPTPLRDGDRRWDPAWADGLTDLQNDVWLRGARLFLAAERAMGVRIEEAWFTGSLRSAEIPDPSDYPQDAWSIP